MATDRETLVVGNHSLDPFLHTNVLSRLASPLQECSALLKREILRGSRRGRVQSRSEVARDLPKQSTKTEPEIATC